MIVGVIDVGTNSVRVLCTDGKRERERDLLITRLGQGVDTARRLHPDAVARTIDVIAAYADRCRAHGAERIRIIATSAVRDAADRDDFCAAVGARTGIEPDVLSGPEEARLGFGGATASLRTDGPILIVDIGGGSTELIRDVDTFISLDIGSVRLSERHIAGDPPSSEELEGVAADAAAQLEHAAAVIGAQPAGTMVGLAGTITTATAVALKLPAYDRAKIHGAVLTRADVEQVRDLLARMTSAQRRELPVMPPGREDVIVAGLVILEQVMDRFSSNEVVVSESDILDGTAQELLSKYGA